MGAVVPAVYFFVATYWFQIAVVVASAASYYLATRAMDQDADSDYTADHGLRSNTRSTNEPLKVLYGLNSIGGNDIYYFGEGSDNEELWLVQTLGEGVCGGIKDRGSMRRHKGHRRTGPGLDR